MRVPLSAPRDAFAITPDPRFAFASAAFAAAHEALSAGLARGAGLMALVGPAGCGKTMLLRALEAEVVRRGALAFFRFQPPRSLDDLLGSLLADCKVAPPAGEDERLEALTRSIARRRAGPALLLVDEAHRFDERDLLAFARLCEWRGARRDGVQVILAGAPDLAERLRTPELALVAPRVAALARLAPLRPDEVAPYVAHRLGTARPTPSLDWRRPRFEADAIARLTLLSGGVPRTINRLCAAALADGARSLDADSIDEAAFACGMGRPPDSYLARAFQTVSAARPRRTDERRGLQVAAFTAVAAFGIVFVAPSGSDMAGTETVAQTLSAPPQLAQAADAPAPAEDPAPTPETDDDAPAPEPSGATDLPPVEGDDRTGDDNIGPSIFEEVGPDTSDIGDPQIAEPATQAAEPPAADATPVDTPPVDRAATIAPEPAPPRATAESPQAPVEPAADATPAPDVAAPTHTESPAETAAAAPPPDAPVAAEPAPTPAPSIATLPAPAPSGSADRTPPAPSPVPTPMAIVELERLVERGQAMLRQGDPATARLFFERAAAQGHAGAMAAVAQTFDPLELRRMGVVGQRGDPARAIDWYKRAADAGDRASGDQIRRLNDFMSRAGQAR